LAITRFVFARSTIVHAILKSDAIISVVAKFCAFSDARIFMESQVSTIDTSSFDMIISSILGVIARVRGDAAPASSRAIE
jgi:hypothetical protein